MPNPGSRRNASIPQGWVSCFTMTMPPPMASDERPPTPRQGPHPRPAVGFGWDAVGLTCRAVQDWGGVRRERAGRTGCADRPGYAAGAAAVARRPSAADAAALPPRAVGLVPAASHDLHCR